MYNELDNYIKTIRDILLLAHKQAFCWTDEWYDKTYESIVDYERETYEKTNEKVINLRPINEQQYSKNLATEKNIAEFD